MDSSFDPLLEQQLSPDKAQLIRQLVQEAAEKNQSELLPFLLTISSRIRNSNLELTQQETDLLVQRLTSNLSPEERKKVRLLRQLSKMISQRDKTTP